MKKSCISYGLNVYKLIRKKNSVKSEGDIFNQINQSTSHLCVACVQTELSQLNIVKVWTLFCQLFLTHLPGLLLSTVSVHLLLTLLLSAYRGFPTRKVYLYYISCLRYTILVGNHRYTLLLFYHVGVKMRLVGVVPGFSLGALRA